MFYLTPKELEVIGKDELLNIIKNNASVTSAKILIARYGLDDGKQKTLGEVQTLFPQITRERIRQTEKRFVENIKSKGII